MKSLTFTRKISLSIALASLIVAVIVSGFVYGNYNRWAERQETALLADKLKQFSLRMDDMTFLPSLLKPGGSLEKGNWRSLFKPDLSSFAADLGPGQHLEMLDEGGKKLSEAGSPIPDGAAIRYQAEQDVRLPVVGAVKLRLSDTGQAIDTTAQREVGRLLLLGLLLAAAMAVVVGELVARSALSPIRTMIREARSIGAGDLSKRLRVPAAKDELHQLGETFNGLLDQLEGAFDQQRRFVADASHELKTPLAIIEGHGRMIQRWGGRSPDVLEESLAYMMDETKRMKALVAQLLLLAEAEGAIGEDMDERSNLRSVWDELLPQMDQLNASVRLIYPKGGSELPIRMPAGAAYQVLRNIMENAVKYTPEGGMVQIGEFAEEQRAVVTVTDSGIGIPPEQLPHIFDRFYRAEGSRNRDRGGSGLGLAIAKTIMERYGGSIEIESEPGKGTRATLCFIRG